MTPHATEPDRARYQRRNVLLLYVLACLTTTSRGATELTYPLNLNQLGYPLPIIGATVALFGFGSLASRLPGGAWYRLSRARGLSAAALAVMGLCSIALGPAEAWALQAGLGAVHGFTFGLSTTLLMALLIDVRPRGANMAATMAWYTAAVSSGYGISAPLASESIVRFGHAFAFMLAGLVGLLAAGLTLALRPPAEHEPPAESSEREPVPATARGWRALTGLPAGVWLASLLVFYVNFVSDTYYTFFPIYALSIGISLVTIGFLKSVHSFVATGIRFAAAALLRALPSGVVNHVAVLTMAASVVALSVVTSETLLLPIFALLGLCRGLLRVTSTTMVADERHRHPGINIGIASGVFNAGLDAGTMLGPAITGSLAGTFDIPTTLRIVALALPTLYYALWFSRRLRTPRPASAGLGKVSS